MPTIDFPSGVTATNPTFLVGANATDPAKLAVTANGLTVLSSATDLDALTALGGYPSAAYRYAHLETFLNGTSSVGQGLATAHTGGTQSQPVFDNRQGVLGISTNAAASANQIGCISTAASSTISLGFGLAKNVWTMAPALALPDGVNTGDLRCGFFDSNTATESVDAVMFRSVDGGNFFAVCRSNNTETTVDTGVAPVLDTFMHFVVQVNAAATSVTFQIYTAPVDGSAPTSLYSGTIATNIPTGAGRQVGHGAKVLRVAATAVALGLNIDVSYLGLDHPAILPF